MKLKEGDKAPKFALADRGGKLTKLEDLPGEFRVVYFYPKDDTPGCTIEAQEFNGFLKEFKKAGAAVVGISGGSNATKQKFCDKYDLDLTLLSDSDFAIAKSFGAYGKKKFMGREYQGILRSTFLLNKANKIVKMYTDVSPKGHAEQVLSDIKSAKKPAARRATASPRPLGSARPRTRRK